VDIIALLVITVIIAGGGIWMVTRPASPKKSPVTFKTLDETLAKRFPTDQAKIITAGDKLAEKRDAATKQKE
jgi:hypothetical protein